MSQPASLDALGHLHENYGGLMSQEVSYQTFQRNKSYFQPLGKLTRQQIQEGREVLNKIKQLFDDKVNDKEKLLDLTNQFFTIIPSQEESLPMIDTPVLLQEKFTMLDALEQAKLQQQQ
jgi:hypothetical protein